MSRWSWLSRRSANYTIGGLVSERYGQTAICDALNVRKLVRAISSGFDAGGGDAFDEAALSEQEDHDDGQHHHRRDRHHQVPGRAAGLAGEAYEVQQADRERVLR